MKCDQVVVVCTCCHVQLQFLGIEIVFSITVYIVVVVSCVDCCTTLSSAATVVC